jgi:hypothetical protein
MYPGEAAELIARLDRIKAPAFVRTGDNKIIGYTEECQYPASCEIRRKHRWHVWAEHGEPYIGMDCPWSDEE